LPTPHAIPSEKEKKNFASLIGSLMALLFFILFIVFASTSSHGGPPPLYSCAKSISGSDEYISPPVISQVFPAIVCTDHLMSQNIVIRGNSFIVWDGHPPIVKVNGVPLSTIPDECNRIPKVIQHEALSCNQLNVTLSPQIPVTSMSATIDVRDYDGLNLDPSQCFTTRNDLLLFVPSPTFFDVFPPVICNPGASDFSRFVNISGINFMKINDSASWLYPKLLLNGSPVESNSYQLDNCVTFSNGRQSVQNCSKVMLNVTTNNLRQVNSISMSNPDSCTTPQAIVFGLVEKGSFTSINPEFSCARDSETEVQLRGNGILVVDQTPPTVFMNETPLTVVRWDNCTKLPLATHTAFQCNVIDVLVPPLLPQAQIAPFQQTFRIVPPNLPECTITNDRFAVASPPLINAINPPFIYV
jgi:hypothetical protein